MTESLDLSMGSLKVEASPRSMGVPAARPDSEARRRGIDPVILLPGLVAAMACLDLVGWVLHIPRLTSVFAGYATMKPNAALCLGLLAFACAMRRRQGISRLRGWLADGVAAVCLCVSVGTLLEDAFGGLGWLDGMILQVPASRAGEPPGGRMALGTAVCLTLIGLSLVLLDRVPKVSVWFFGIVGSIALSAMIGFAFNAGPLFGAAWLRSLAVHTATGLLLLALAGLASRPEREPLNALLAQAYRDGRTRWLLVGVTVLPLLVAFPPLLLMRAGRVDAGFAMGLLVVLLTGIQTTILWQDSSALRLAEQRRAQAERALLQSEKLAVVGRLSASIAHEINNPLESVGTLVYLIQGAESLDEASKYARMAQEELLRVTQITSQTLKSVRDEPKHSHCEPVEIADSALRLLHGRVVASGVTVTRRFEDGLGEVRCRDGELRQVFINLISNALDATARGGKLVVKIRAGRRWAEGKTREQRGVRILFADNGTGMSRVVQGKIFEPFFTTKLETGNGLGLWVARDLIEKHGGSLRVWSSTRKGASGTVFTVFLPLRKDPGDR